MMGDFVINKMSNVLNKMKAKITIRGFFYNVWLLRYN